jgi:ElaB/YqjD/DUF883 family membrane-anchored ribosome-binding protein
MKTNGHESVVEPVIEKVAARAHQAVDKAQKVATRAAGRAVDRAERAMVPAADLYGQSCEYVSANPLRAVGIAVVAGFLLAKILW